MSFKTALNYQLSVFVFDRVINHSNRALSRLSVREDGSYVAHDAWLFVCFFNQSSEGRDGRHGDLRRGPGSGAGLQPAVRVGRGEGMRRGGVDPGVRGPARAEAAAVAPAGPGGAPPEPGLLLLTTGIVDE